MNRNIWILVILTGAVVAYSVAKPKSSPVAAATQPAAGQRAIVAAGRVEPASEEIKIGSDLDGRLRSVPVEEGQSVRAGQVLAELDNGDYAARVALARATLKEREAALERLLNGARAEERTESQAGVREAEAVASNARLERERRSKLLDRGAISRTEFDTADREWLVAQARLDASRERHAVVEDQSRPEDIQRARAEVERSRAQIAEAEALLAKTIIRSPINAVVLRKKLKAGESVSGKGDVAIVTLGDIAHLRIRVDVDETDVSRLHLGQAAYFTAITYGDRRFTGHVSKIGQILGRKNVRTDEPTERVDTKILETLVDLDPSQSLPVGLRVDAFLELSKGN